MTIEQRLFQFMDGDMVEGGVNRHLRDARLRVPVRGTPLDRDALPSRRVELDSVRID